MMRTQNFYDEKIFTVKSLIIIAFFLLCLQKYSIAVSGSGVSANYVYVFMPLVFWLIGMKRRLVKRKQVVQIVLVYSLIYFFGFPGDIFELNNLNTPIRRLLSYLVFLFPLLLSFVEFKPSDIRIFKISIILVCIVYSLNSILTFSSIPRTQWGELKTFVGSQRYGFILCFGFFIALFDHELILKNWIFPKRVLICSAILIGAIFTFSRATFVALIGAGLFFLIAWLFRKNTYNNRELGFQVIHRKFKVRYWIVSLVLIVSVFIAFQSYYDTNFLLFYQARFIDPLLDATLLRDALGKDPGSSEGVRYYLLLHVLDYLAVHPLFGSNYKGLYLLYEELSGGASTHNQYTDVFLRTGLFGGILWLYLLYRIFRFCRHDKGLQIGLVSIIIYGLFHETFKESQGSFVFGMLLSFSYIRASLKYEREPWISLRTKNALFEQGTIHPDTT